MAIPELPLRTQHPARSRIFSPDNWA